LERSSPNYCDYGLQRGITTRDRMEEKKQNQSPPFASSNENSLEMRREQVGKIYDSDKDQRIRFDGRIGTIDL